MRQPTNNSGTWEYVRPVGHAEAKEVALRLIAGAFDREDSRPHFSIPCRPDHDDDCLILAYIFQQEIAAIKGVRENGK